MIVCPNCNHHNPEGAIQCEACYTALPQMIPCPNCGLSIQTDAVFCGQCGYNLHSTTSTISQPLEITKMSNSEENSPSTPESFDNLDELNEASLWEEEEEETPQNKEQNEVTTARLSSNVVESSPPTPTVSPVSPMSTTLQVHTAKLLHVQTQTSIELPNHLSVVHIGKPNEQIPPDIDVSGFPNSEVVSRVHADIRVEGDTYYLEDVGSSNGTYVNHTPLPQGNRHCLRPGDRVSLGKGDLVTFIFQVSS